MTKYTDTEIKSRLENLPGWNYENRFITKDFIFKNFSEAFAFMTRVAFVQETMNHHTNWSGVYNRVTLRLRTHDADGITEKDIAFAEKVEKMG